MTWLNALLDQSQVPVITAFILGLMTAISPCPMATNITAIGFISKNITSKRVVFYNGLIYTLGRVVSYSLLGMLFYFGVKTASLAGFFQIWGEKLIGPLLIITGVLMLGLIPIHIKGLSNGLQDLTQKVRTKFGSVFLLGILFALAFCPYSGVLFFGMLIPLTLSSSGGLWLPVAFAIATGIPVIIFAWLIAFSFQSISKTYERLKTLEIWFRKGVALVFVASGVYLLIMQFTS